VCKKLTIVSAVQFNPKFKNVKENTATILGLVKKSVESGSRLIVLPECATTGYMFNSLEEALEVSETIPGPTTNIFEKTANQLNIYIILGMLEKENNILYNTAVLFGPTGLIGKYRKIHLPFLGVDRFATTGSNVCPVFDTTIGRIGINICYDLRFPESARVLAIKGADIICQPSNWPIGGESLPNIITRARALENRVFLVATNRVGVENGAYFIGKSQIIDPFGNVVREASENEEIITAEFDPEKSRAKAIIKTPGEFELNLFSDRRPELYRDISI
jgi:5-aminopentanamidase